MIKVWKGKSSGQQWTTHKGDHGGGEQDLDQRIVELLKEQIPDGGALFLGQLVGAVLLLAGLDLGFTET